MLKRSSKFQTRSTSSSRRIPRIARRGSRTLSGIALALALFVLVGEGGKCLAEDVDGKLDAAFVLIGEEGRAVARAITRAETCPIIEIDGVGHVMQVRAHPGQMAKRPTASSPEDSKPSDFPVLVCDRSLADAAFTARIGSRILPLPRLPVKRIVVLGDSGCRMKKSDQAWQACNNEGQWPFRLVSEAAAEKKPDLVIHTGDYHYRENACPTPDCKDSPWGYGYDTWEQDLFVPAAKLLEAAPWVVTRGNHEECRRAGQGWWRFLDPRSLEPRRDCNRPEDDAVGNVSAPYAVPIDPDTQLIVFDSAMAASKADDPVMAAYRLQLKRAAQLASRARNNIWVNHHPILGFSPNPGDANKPGPGSGSLQVNFALDFPSLLPPSVQTAIAGHFHLFEAAAFAGQYPSQFVIGTGGSTWSEGTFPKRLPLDANVAPVLKTRPPVATFFARTQFYGFAMLERQNIGWTLTLHDRSGSTVARCRLLGKGVTCIDVN